jgi:hypothetical protein
MAGAEFVNRGDGKRAVHRLNTHELAPVSIHIGLPRAAISGLQQKLSPGITWSKDDLVDVLPGHTVYAKSVANLKARPIGAYVAAGQDRHNRNEESENAEQPQPMRQWEQCADISRQQQPADRAQYAKSDAGNDRDHPHATRPCHVDGVIEILISHGDDARYGKRRYQ